MQADFDILVDTIRYMHGYIIASVYLRALFETKPEHAQFMRIFRVIEVFVFYGGFLKLQFEMTKYDFNN